jgi:hypothetical protein
VRPGDVRTCRSCGASSRPLHDSGGRPYPEGGALIETWTHGPFDRHVLAREGNDLCAWCLDAGLGFPSIMNRPKPGETWTIVGPLKTFEVPSYGLVLPASRPPDAFGRDASISSTPETAAAQCSDDAGGLPAELAPEVVHPRRAQLALF